MTDDVIESTIRLLLSTRAASASICPSDVARALANKESAWRALMPEIRRVAAMLAEQKIIRVTRGVAEVSALSAGGPIRLRLPKS